jgi:hypothetical protein
LGTALTAETIVQGLNFPNLTPRLENNALPLVKNAVQQSINHHYDSPRQQKPMFRGEHNGPGHFILRKELGFYHFFSPNKTRF